MEGFGGPASCEALDPDAGRRLLRGACLGGLDLSISCSSSRPRGMPQSSSRVRGEIGSGALGADVRE